MCPFAISSALSRTRAAVAAASTRLHIASATSSPVKLLTSAPPPPLSAFGGAILPLLLMPLPPPLLSSMPDDATERETRPPVRAMCTACPDEAAAPSSPACASTLSRKASAADEPSAFSASSRFSRPATPCPARLRLLFSPRAAMSPIVASSKTPWPSCSCQSRTDSASCSERKACSHISLDWSHSGSSFASSACSDGCSCLKTFHPSTLGTRGAFASMEWRERSSSSPSCLLSFLFFGLALSMNGASAGLAPPPTPPPDAADPLFALPPPPLPPPAAVEGQPVGLAEAADDGPDPSLATFRLPASLLLSRDAEAASGVFVSCRLALPAPLSSLLPPLLRRFALGGGRTFRTVRRW